MKKIVTTNIKNKETTDEMIRRVIKAFTENLLEDVNKMSFPKKISSIEISTGIEPFSVVKYSIKINNFVTNKSVTTCEELEDYGLSNVHDYRL